MLKNRMDEIVYSIPLIGEQIFETIETDGLIQCLKVSKTWSILAEKILSKRWKNKAIEACLEGKTKIVEILFKVSEAEHEQDVLYIMLMAACFLGHTAIVKLVLNFAATKNIKLNIAATEDTIVFNRPWNNEHYDVVNKLLINITYEATAFMLACNRGHTDIVKILMEQSLELHNQDLNGLTGLMEACWKGQKEVVQLIIEHAGLAVATPIDLNIQEIHGHNAFMLACKRGQKDTVKVFLQHLKSHKLLLNVRDIIGNTALSLACGAEDRDIFFINKGY